MSNTNVKIYRRSIIAFIKLSLYRFLLLSVVCISDLNGQSIIPLKEIKVDLKGVYNVGLLFENIEKQSGLSFSYHKADILKILQSDVTISADLPNLETVLSSIAGQTGLKFSRINNVINVRKDNKKSPAIEEKMFPIEGRVVDDDDTPVPGVNVLIKGTQIGTTTDNEGEYSLEVPGRNSILVFSFIGFSTQEIEADTQTTINVKMMPDMKALDEVVVVGYGQQRLESITGSIAKIDSKDITETKTANLANNLAGRIPGLMINTRGGEPGAENVEIFIRGKGTTGNALPLYVIDGVANRGTFEHLSANDIESISILKDASAAIYGAQAANGVILITTKRGKAGAPVLRYNNAFSATQPSRRQYLMDAVQYLTWIDEQNVRNGRPQIYQNVIDDYRTGSLDRERWTNTDWWSEAMDKWTPQQQHDLNLSGGSNEIKYFVSGQYLNQDAIYKGKEFGYEQINLRSNIDVQVTKYLQLGVDLAGRFENLNGTGNSSATEGLIRGIYNMAPFEAPYYTNGLLRKTSKGNILPNITGASGGAQTENQVYNNKLSFTLTLDKLTKGLSLNSFGAVDLINRKRKDISTPYDIYFLNAQGEYDNLKKETGSVYLFQQFDREISKTYHLRVNYNRTFGDHLIDGFVAYEQNQVRGEYISAQRRDLVSADLPYLFSGSEINKDNDGKGWQSARQNYFGRLNYAYSGKYLLEFTLRHDGSQNFVENKRFGTFPAVSVGWILSEEKFYKAGGRSDDIKIRASWGKMGNDRVNNFQYYQLYNVVDGAVFGETPVRSNGLTPGTVANPEITWEIAEKWNIGADISWANGLLNFVIDAFHEKRSNILTKRNASVPIYTGLILPDENIGKTINRGIEVSATHRNKLRNNLYYKAGTQFTYAKNEIVFMDESPDVPSWQKVEGSPIDRLLVYKSSGLYQSQEEINATAHFPDAKPGDVKFVDINDDGKIDTDDRIILPQGPTPRIVYSFNLGLEWKGIELNAFFQGQAKASTIYRPWDINQDSWYFENRWISREETPDAKSPAAWDMSSNSIQSVSTIWVKENEFLRLKNLELAYTLPKKLVERAGISNLRIYVSGYNLGFVYDKVKLYDPESRSDTGWYYPQQRIITTGMSLSF